MPDWLPEMVSVNPWTENTYEMLYAIFCRDIRDCNLRYIGNNVWIFPDIEEGKETIFWHLTARGVERQKIPRRKRKFYSDAQADAEKERLPDLRRCERLPWIGALIEHPLEPENLAWEYREGDRTIKTYIWINENDFVVILKKYPDGKRRLITSFYVDSSFKRNDFERKYANRIK